MRFGRAFQRVVWVSDHEIRRPSSLALSITITGSSASLWRVEGATPSFIVGEVGALRAIVAHGGARTFLA